MISAEFRRNLWLEFSQQRLISMPLVLFGIFLLVYLFSSNYHAPIANTSVAMYIILIIFWGSRNAAKSVITEIEDRTWDAQRLSPMPPWPMCWGKLFGSTIYNWYGGLICLACYIYFAYPIDGSKSLILAAFLLFLGIMTQAICLLASLVTLQKSRQFGRSTSQAIGMAGLICSIPFILLYINGNKPYIHWYHHSYDAEVFTLFTTLVFCAWALVASFRYMRLELQYKNTPWVWCVFLVFLPVFLAGFFPGNGAEALYSAYIVVWILSYVAIFSDKKDPRNWKRLVNTVYAKDLSNLLPNLPPWIINIIVLPVLAVLILPFDIIAIDFFTLDKHFKYFLANSYLFLLRDIAVIVYFCFSVERKRAEAAALFYLIVLYVLIPLILKLLGLDTLSACLQPLGTEYPLVTLISGLVQVVLMFILLLGRWSEYNNKLKSNH